MQIASLFKPKKYENKILSLLRDTRHSLGMEVTSAVKIDSHKIIFSTKSSAEYLMRAVLAYTEEKTTMRWIQELINPDDVVFDIGANVGSYSLLIGHKIKDAQGKGKVFAFEPESQNFAALNKNIVLNSLQNIIIPVATAISDAQSFSHFNLSRFATGAAMHSLASGEKNTGTAAHVQGCVCVSIDTLLQLNSDLAPNHIKVDVDGLEDKVLAGMERTLKNKELKSVIFEIETREKRDYFINKLSNAGFSIFSEEMWPSEGLEVFNIVFSRVQ